MQLQFSAMEVTYSLGPLLGEHTVKGHGGLGHEPGQIAALRDTGAVSCAKDDHQQPIGEIQ